MAKQYMRSFWSTLIVAYFTKTALLRPIIAAPSICARLNGRVVRDQSGTSLRDESEACAYAVRCTPLTLRKSVSPRRNTYLALEVSDGQRTLCVVRGKVVLEKH